MAEKLGSPEHDEKIEQLIQLGERELTRMEADIRFALRCIRMQRVEDAAFVVTMRKHLEDMGDSR